MKKNLKQVMTEIKYNDIISGSKGSFKIQPDYIEKKKTSPKNEMQNK